MEYVAKSTLSLCSGNIQIHPCLDHGVFHDRETYQRPMCHLSRRHTWALRDCSAKMETNHEGTMSPHSYVTDGIQL